MAAVVKAKTPVKTPADFQKTHDKAFIIPERFREGIKALGKTGWMYMGDFMREHKISPQDGALYRDLFKDYILEADKKMIICGSVAQAKEFRESI
jgi:hypothetical protein